jgi:hypothetical protein
MSIRPKIEAALTATADRLSPGAGSKVARHAKNDLATIEASSDNLARRYANEDVRLATPAIFETKEPAGDPVHFTKAHDGVIVVFADSFVFVRGMGFGAREVDAVSIADVSVERVTAVLDGREVPAVRVTGHAGKPKFVAAIDVEKETAQPAEQLAVRDELAALLGG